MSNLKFYVSPTTSFIGAPKSFEEADYVILGVPYDRTSTYRPGARFGPSALREASLNVETYNMKLNLDVEQLKYFDAGDLTVVDSPEETVRRVEMTVRDIAESRKIPILIGGEHTITYGAAKAFSGDVGVVSFDAHADVRDEYHDAKLSHTTFMRRLAEAIGPNNIVEVGVRAVSKEEYEYLNTSGLTYITTERLRSRNLKDAAEVVESKTKKFRKLYITIDMDVLDPAYAPAVGNPEGDGITPNTLITILHKICDRRVVGLDLVEVTPHYDSGATAIQSVKILFEALCALENSRKAKSSA